ncbi:16S rRNA processing protein RimM [Salibacterium qingdaonense]|uniref:Ribosome maturation factor RimM n=2 Tax=Salibacterium qingdaonense TaxID=266892 RepID=A0A1I4PGU5_9BACI|nr:16S rRNA processing protein RimM [Salibacterium qingdaonense]
MMRMEWFNVGKIVNTHGIKGEWKVFPITDFEEERFAQGMVLYLSKGSMERTPVTVSHSRRHKQHRLLTVEEISSVEEAETWRDAVLQIPETELTELREDEFYYYEIIGCRVYAEEGTLLGEVKEVQSPGANDVWVVEAAGGGSDILVPYIDDIVKQVNVKEKTITIHVMEGLLP